MEYNRGGVHPHPTIGQQPGNIGDEYAGIRPEQIARSKICPCCGQPIKGGQKPPSKRPTPPGQFPTPGLPGQEPGIRPPQPPYMPKPLPPGFEHPAKQPGMKPIEQPWRTEPWAGYPGGYEEWKKQQEQQKKFFTPGISKPTYPLPYPKKYRR